MSVVYCHSEMLLKMNHYESAYKPPSGNSLQTISEMTVPNETDGQTPISHFNLNLYITYKLPITSLFLKSTLLVFRSRVRGILFLLIQVIQLPSCFARRQK